MKRTVRTLAVVPLCVASLGALAAAPSPLAVSGCWIRSLPGDLPSGAYFDIANTGSKAIDLTGVETDAFGMAMLHRTQSNGSTSTMEMVDHATVPANGTLKFAPGGYHVMLEKPEKPVTVGSTIPLTFSFDDGEKVTAQCAVKSAGTMSN